MVVQTYTYPYGTTLVNDELCKDLSQEEFDTRVRLMNKAACDIAFRAELRKRDAERAQEEQEAVAL